MQLSEFVRHRVKGTGRLHWYSKAIKHSMSYMGVQAWLGQSSVLLAFSTSNVSEQVGQLGCRVVPETHASIQHLQKQKWMFFAHK